MSKRYTIITLPLHLVNIDFILVCKIVPVSQFVVVELNRCSMMTKENFNLSWVSHPLSSTKLLVQLLRDQELTDVTLVCGDGQEIRAHKAVLGSASPVLKKLFSRSGNGRTVLYLSGLDFSNLKGIVNFIYLGEATVDQTNIDPFFRVCKEFQIEGLSDYSILPAGIQHSALLEINIEENTGEIENGQNMKFEKVTFSCENCDYETTCEESLGKHNNDLHTEQEMNEYTSDTHIDEGQQATKISEPIKLHEKTKKGHHEVDKIQPICNLSRELEYPCNKCNKYSSKSKHTLKRHVDFVHNGFKLKCEECNKLFSGESPLRRHIRRDHIGVMRYCDLCDFMGRSTDDVWRHKSKNHFN